MPAMGPSPPKTPATGSHLAVVRKFNPNVESAGQPPIVRLIRMPASAARSAVAAARQAALNSGSIAAPRGSASTR